MKYTLPILFILLFAGYKLSAQAPAAAKIEIKGTVTDSATNQPMLVLDLDPAITATAAIAALAAF